MIMMFITIMRIIFMITPMLMIIYIYIYYIVDSIDDIFERKEFNTEEYLMKKKVYIYR